MTCWNRQISKTLTLAAMVLFGACNAEASVGVQVIEGLMPSPGETNVEPGCVIRIDLRSEPSRDNLQDTIRVFDAQDRVVAGTVRVDSFSLVFLPDTRLDTNSTYRVCIQDLRSADGTPIRGYRSDPELDQVEPWSTTHCYEFSTKPTLEIVRTSFDPTTATLRIYFSDDVAADSLSAVRVLSHMSGEPIDSRIRYNPDLRRLTVILDAAPDVQEPVIVDLPPSVRSLDGHPLANGRGDEIVLQGSATNSLAE